MDFNAFDTKTPCNDGAWMVIKGPDGKETEARLLVAGPDSDKWESIRLDLARNDLSKGGKKLYEFLCKAVLDWDGITLNGKPMKFSMAKCRQLLKNAPYIASQVDLFIGDRANFLKPSASK